MPGSLFVASTASAIKVFAAVIVPDVDMSLAVKSPLALISPEAVI